MFGLVVGVDWMTDWQEAAAAGVDVCREEVAAAAAAAAAGVAAAASAVVDIIFFFSSPTSEIICGRSLCPGICLSF